jgi:hypothetical protein
MAIVSQYQSMYQSLLSNVFSFNDPKTLRIASGVCQNWSKTADMARDLYEKRRVRQQESVCLPPSRHPVLGMYQLLENSQAGEPIPTKGMRRRFLCVPAPLRQAIFEAYSEIAKCPSSTLEMVVCDHEGLKGAIEKVVLDRFSLLKPEPMKNVAYRIWKSFGGVSHDQRGGKIDPFAFGTHHAKKNIPYLIDAMNGEQLLDYPCTYVPILYADSQSLMKRILRKLEGQDENWHVLISAARQGAETRSMLESLPCYLRDRIDVLSSDPACIIPHGLAPRVINILFSFSVLHPNSKTIVDAFGLTLPKGVIDIATEDYLIAQRIFPFEKGFFQTKEEILTRLHQKIEDLSIGAFFKYYRRNSALPPWDENLKSTVFLGGLILYKMQENPGSSLWLNDLVQRLASHWHSRGVDLEDEVNTRIYQLSPHPKTPINNVNRLQNHKHFKMALVLVLDELLYKEISPKIAIATELLNALDACIGSQEMDENQKMQMDKRIALLHRILKGEQINQYVCRYSPEANDDPQWSVGHRYDNLFILRKAVVDVLYKNLFPDD